MDTASITYQKCLYKRAAATIFTAVLTLLFAVTVCAASFEAETPVLTLVPSGITAEVGARFWLAVDGYTNDGGVISYQWYMSETDSMDDIKPIKSSDYPYYGRQNTFTPEQDVGTVYYCAEVINTLEKDGETAVASVFSSLTAVTFTKPEADTTETAAAGAETTASDETGVPAETDASVDTDAAAETGVSEETDEIAAESTAAEVTETEPETAEPETSASAVQSGAKTGTDDNFYVILTAALGILLLCAVFVIIVLLLRIRSLKQGRY